MPAPKQRQSKGQQRTAMTAKDGVVLEKMMEPKMEPKMEPRAAKGSQGHMRKVKKGATLGRQG